MSFDDEMAVFEARVLESFGGVILLFLVADKAAFVAPLFRVGMPLAVEFIGPDELPFIGGEGGDEESEKEQLHC